MDGLIKFDCLFDKTPQEIEQCVCSYKDYCIKVSKGLLPPPQINEECPKCGEKITHKDYKDCNIIIKGWSWGGLAGETSHLDCKKRASSD